MANKRHYDGAHHKAWRAKVIRRAGGLDGYDGTVMPDIPEEWAAQIEGEMQGALHQTELSVDPSIAENWASNTRATLQSYLNNMGLTVDVTPNVSGASSALTTGRWVSALVEGSHAEGLDYVPHDNYIAALHRGEKILTAAEAARYRAAETAHGTGQTGGDAAAWRQMMNAIGYMLANVKVQIDGQTAGSLLAPVVSEAIAKEFTIDDGRCNYEAIQKWVYLRA